MSIITELRPQKNKQRINIYLDGVYFCGLQIETAVKNGLKSGKFIEKQRLEEIQLESEGRRAYDAALKLLDKKQYSESEIAAKLKSKGYLDNVIFAVVEKLKMYGFVDDAIYARNFLSGNKTKSRREIVNKLRLKGISPQIIEGTTEVIDRTVESANCLITAQKYAKHKEKTVENKLKTYRYLTSKGFDFEQARSAADRVFGNMEDTEND